MTSVTIFDGSYYLSLQCNSFRDPLSSTIMMESYSWKVIKSNEFSVVTAFPFSVFDSRKSLTEWKSGNKPFKIVNISLLMVFNAFAALWRIRKFISSVSISGNEPSQSIMARSNSLLNGNWKASCFWKSICSFCSVAFSLALFNCNSDKSISLTWYPCFIDSKECRPFPQPISEFSGTYHM